VILLAHLWQSTVCAVLAALFALALRKAPARTRHALWVFASVKFLVPFSLLVATGSVVGAWMPSVATPRASVAAHWLDQSLYFWNLRGAAGSDAEGGLPTLLVSGLLFGWACGVAWLAQWRWRTWRALSMLARAATPLERGREADAMQRVFRPSSRTPRIELLACDASVEPGVLGVLRPKVLWPAGLSDRLTDAELDAILAHEVCHVARRDNAFALMQLIVETLFWFHPVVWWLSARLVSERERACDEEVLRMGTDKRRYAEGILKVCGFCLRSPSACVAGVGGSNLTARVERIMGHRALPRLSRSMGVLLGCVGAAVAAAPLVTGVLQAHRPALSTNVSRAAGEKPTSVQSGEVIRPKVVSSVNPQYTAAALKARIQGAILLAVVVLPDGTVGKVRIAQSLDSVYGLDDEAVKAVKQWRFEPGTRHGKPVAVEVEITMTFSLK
jgi:bla regulator protein blaR1